jgi:hypothetical protein
MSNPGSATELQRAKSELLADGTPRRASSASADGTMATAHMPSRMSCLGMRAMPAIRWPLWTSLVTSGPLTCAVAGGESKLQRRRTVTGALPRHRNSADRGVDGCVAMMMRAWLPLSPRGTCLRAWHVLPYMPVAIAALMLAWVGWCRAVPQVCHERGLAAGARHGAQQQLQQPPQQVARQPQPRSPAPGTLTC